MCSKHLTHILNFYYDVFFRFFHSEQPWSIEGVVAGMGLPSVGKSVVLYIHLISAPSPRNNEIRYLSRPSVLKKETSRGETIDTIRPPSHNMNATDHFSPLTSGQYSFIKWQTQGDPLHTPLMFKPESILYIISFKSRPQKCLTAY